MRQSWWVALTLFFNPFCISGIATGESHQLLTEERGGVATVSKDLQNFPDLQEDPSFTSPVPVKDGKNILQEILSGSVTGSWNYPNAFQKFSQAQSDTDYPISLIFVSMGIKRNILKQIIRYHCGDPQVRLLWKGFPLNQAETLDRGLFRLQHLIYENCPEGISSHIDPRAFIRFDITQVPAVAQVDEKDNLLELRRGSYAISRGEKKQEGNNELSNSGSDDNFLNIPLSYPVTEPDLREMLRNAAALVDWEEKKRSAMVRFWQNPPDTHLPHASSGYVYKISLTSVLNHPLLNEKGQVLIPAGKEINPLELKDFNLILIVFNPSLPCEVEKVREYFKRHRERKDPRKILLLAATLNIPCGKENSGTEENFQDHTLTCAYQGYQHLVREFGEVYLLDDYLVQRFKIFRTPTIITAHPASPRKFLLARVAGESDPVPDI